MSEQELRVIRAIEESETFDSDFDESAAYAAELAARLGATETE